MSVFFLIKWKHTLFVNRGGIHLKPCTLVWLPLVMRALPPSRIDKFQVLYFFLFSTDPLALADQGPVFLGFFALVKLQFRRRRATASDLRGTAYCFWKMHRGLMFILDY